MRRIPRPQGSTAWYARRSKPAWCTGPAEKEVPHNHARRAFADGDVADQVRVTTPARAREIGSDFIVVGRPITAAADPVAAYRRCVDEFCG